MTVSEKIKALLDTAARRHARPLSAYSSQRSPRGLGWSLACALARKTRERSDVMRE
jgi:hypothetical protein